MVIARSQRRVAAKRLAAVARELLEASILCAIATVARNRSAYVNTAYFAWTDAFEIVWLSHPDAQHSRNVDANRSAAIAVIDSTQTWGNPDRGVQLFGSARATVGRAQSAAATVYRGRFPDYSGDDFSTYRLYILRTHRVKLFDERTLGAGVFVTAKLERGHLSWERTDVYQP